MGAASEFGEVFDFADFAYAGFGPVGDVAGGVDDDGAAFGAVEGFLAHEEVVGLADFSARVGKEVVGDVELLAVGFVGEGVIAGDAEDNGVLTFFEGGEFGAKGAVLGGADGGEVHRIEEQDDFFAAKVGELHEFFGLIHHREIGSGGAEGE